MKVSLVALFLIATASSVFARKEIEIVPTFYFVKELHVKRISTSEAMCLQEAIAASTQMIGWTAVEGAELDSMTEETEDEEMDEEDGSRRLSIGGWTMIEGPSVDDSLGEDFDFDDEDNEDRRLGLEIGCDQYASPPFFMIFFTHCESALRRRNLNQITHTMHELRYRSKKLIEVALADICNDLVRDCVDYGLVESLAYPTCGVKVKKIKYEVEDDEED